jgi:hypothetical protein
MLQGNTNFGFLTSADEIIFLRIDVDTNVEYDVNIAPPGAVAEYADIDVNTEPRLYYSDPIKHTDVLDPAKGTIPVKMALLHVVHRVMVGTDWKMPAEKAFCTKYFVKLDAGEKLKPQPPPRHTTRSTRRSGG